MSLIGRVFINSKTQAVQLPEDAQFPGSVKKVIVRVVGNERILTPVNSTWDSFFLSDETVTDDFMNERGPQEQQEREPF
ncbi:type II toxin-antitoxin system VapB family antitoxin [Zooshikella ganghwensis]|uniref:type II toxin-antitoxin system VapB family antitoxin n=1 Tax=Zooshikella ganghwensis TaxID=202772 RepID=UPI000419DD07|nr:type II toxin-antitoxin system VapB family antitoxin [Zooshikella ganghwensis]